MGDLNSMFRSRGLAVAGALAAALLGPGAAGAKPMSQALDELLRTHPRVLAAEKNLSAAHESTREADAGFLPTVTLSGDSGLERIDSVERRRIGEDPSSTRRDALSLSLTQNLFNGFETTSRSRIGTLGERSAKAGLGAVRQTLLFQGIDAYLSVLREREVLDIAQRNVRTLDTQLALERERQRQGAGLRVDVLQTRARLQIARENRAAIQGRLDAALARYLELYDEPAQLDEMAAPPAPDGALPATAEAAVEQGRRDNPALAQSERELDIAAERRTLAKAGFYPDIDLVVEGSWENDIEGIMGVRREQRVLLRGRWDLFDGFRRNAREARAGQLYGVRLNTHSSLRRDVESRIRRSWSALIAARKTRNFLRNAAQIANEVFEARRKLRQNGRDTLVNVLDAEQELNDVRQRLTQAEYATRLAVYRVLLHTGGLEAALALAGGGR